MKSRLSKTLFAASICAITCAAPGVAQESAQGAAPAATETVDTATVAIPVVSSDAGYRAKGPVPVIVAFKSDRALIKMKELRIVGRAEVVGWKIAFGALSLLGSRVSIEKEDVYGDEITDSVIRSKIASPFLVDLPTALDQRLSALVAETAAGDTAPRFNKAMTITPSGYTLVYHELMADTEKEDLYQLHLSARFSKPAEGETSIFRLPPRKKESWCSYLSKPRPLAQWKENDYEAVAVEQKIATQDCIDAIAPSLPHFLGFDSTSKIRAAKINCKNVLNQCVGEAEKIPEPNDGKKLCKAEYSQCVTTDVKSLIAETPIGKCKATFAACKEVVFDKARALHPDAKPEKAEFVPCSNEYRTCAAAAR